MNFQLSIDQEGLSGLMIGAVLIFALAKSAAFRNVALFGMGIVILYVYVKSGMGGLQKMSAIIAADTVRHRPFALGIAAGGLIATMMLVLVGRTRGGRQ